MHELNYLHNDVKLENILVGHKDTSRLYLIDFGLAIPFLGKNGKHLEKMNRR